MAQPIHGPQQYAGTDKNVAGADNKLSVAPAASFESQGRSLDAVHNPARSAQPGGQLSPQNESAQQPNNRPMGATIAQQQPSRSDSFDSSEAAKATRMQSVPSQVLTRTHEPPGHLNANLLALVDNLPEAQPTLFAAQQAPSLVSLALQIGPSLANVPSVIQALLLATGWHAQADMGQVVTEVESFEARYKASLIAPGKGDTLRPAVVDFEVTLQQMMAAGMSGEGVLWPGILATALEWMLPQWAVARPDLNPAQLAMMALWGPDLLISAQGSTAIGLWAHLSRANDPLGLPTLAVLRGEHGASDETFAVLGTRYDEAGVAVVELADARALFASQGGSGARVMQLEEVLRRLVMAMSTQGRPAIELSASHRAKASVGRSGCCMVGARSGSGPAATAVAYASSKVAKSRGPVANRCVHCVVAQQLSLPAVP